MERNITIYIIYIHTYHHCFVLLGAVHASFSYKGASQYQEKGKTISVLTLVGLTFIAWKLPNYKSHARKNTYSYSSGEQKKNKSTQMRFLHVKVWCTHSFEEKMIEISLIPLGNPTTRMNKYPSKKGTSPFWMHMVSFFGKRCKPFRVPQKKNGN